MIRKTIFIATTLATTALALVGCAAPGAQKDIDIQADQVFRASFLPGPGQDLTRLDQDETQKECSVTRAAPPDALADTIKAREAKHMVYPDDGKLMGDWKAGAKIFEDGFGYRIGSFIPSNPKVARGGNCYACHQGEAKEAAFGNMGPTLLHYGKLRGQSEAIVKYTYEKIYNAKAFNACSAMPRLGHSKVLSPKQITDLVAYLVLPESPINK
jgi:sulfur-oxidizing protein SoxX